MSFVVAISWVFVRQSPNATRCNANPVLLFRYEEAARFTGVTFSSARGFSLASTALAGKAPLEESDYGQAIRTKRLVTKAKATRTAAKRYNDAQRKFVESGKVEPAAKDAEHALETDEAEELKRAEEKAARTRGRMSRSARFKSRRLARSAATTRSAP